MAHVNFCTLFHYHHILAQLQVRTGPLWPCHPCLLIHSLSKNSLRAYLEPGPVLSTGNAAVSRRDEAMPLWK